MIIRIGYIMFNTWTLILLYLIIRIGYIVFNIWTLILFYLIIDISRFRFNFFIQFLTIFLYFHMSIYLFIILFIKINYLLS